MPDKLKDFPETIVKDHYVDFQHEIVEFLSAQLIDFRLMFGGDLDELLVYLMVSRYWLREERSSRNENGPEESMVAPLSLSRIADLTGIPRETVRRKLLSLQKRGLMERVGKSEWRVAFRDGAPAIRTGFEEFLQREMRRAVKLVKALKIYL